MAKEDYRQRLFELTAKLDDAKSLKARLEIHQEISDAHPYTRERKNNG